MPAGRPRKYNWEEFDVGDTLEVPAKLATSVRMSVHYWNKTVGGVQNKITLSGRRSADKLTVVFTRVS